MLRWDDRLQCYVASVSYDFNKKCGRLDMPDDSCCDMTACIALFKGIDPHVERIDTFAKLKLDTSYFRREGEWDALVWDL